MKTFMAIVGGMSMVFGIFTAGAYLGWVDARQEDWMLGDFGLSEEEARIKAREDFMNRSVK